MIINHHEIKTNLRNKHGLFSPTGRIVKMCAWSCHHTELENEAIPKEPKLTHVFWWHNLRNKFITVCCQQDVQWSFPPLFPTEHQFWQSPMDDSTFVGAWESSGEVPAHCWRKKSTIIDTLKKAWFYLHCPSHKAVQLSAERDALSQWFLPQGKVRACEWMPSSPR